MPQKITEILPKHDGVNVACTIRKSMLQKPGKVLGRIHWDKNQCYILHNNEDFIGSAPENHKELIDKYGYKYAWSCLKGTERDLNSTSIFVSDILVPGDLESYNIFN